MTRAPHSLLAAVVGLLLACASERAMGAPVVAMLPLDGAATKISPEAQNAFLNGLRDDAAAEGFSVLDAETTGRRLREAKLDPARIPAKEAAGALGAAMVVTTALVSIPEIGEEARIRVEGATGNELAAMTFRCGTVALLLETAAARGAKVFHEAATRLLLAARLVPIEIATDYSEDVYTNVAATLGTHEYPCPAPVAKETPCHLTVPRDGVTLSVTAGRTVATETFTLSAAPTRIRLVTYPSECLWVGWGLVPVFGYLSWAKATEPEPLGIGGKVLLGTYVTAGVLDLLVSLAGTLSPVSFVTEAAASADDPAPLRANQPTTTLGG